MFSPPELRADLSLGNALLDAQHEQALAMLTTAAAMLDDPAISDQQFHDYLNVYWDFLQLHFASEEAILARNGCPDLAAHKAEHDATLEALGELLEAAMDGRVARLRLLEFMSDLIARHLPEADLPLKDFLSDARY